MGVCPATLRYVILWCCGVRVPLSRSTPLGLLLSPSLASSLADVVVHTFSPTPFICFWLLSKLLSPLPRSNQRFLPYPPPCTYASSYDGAAGSRAGSTCSISPCRLAPTGLLQEIVGEGKDDAEDEGPSAPEHLTIKVEPPSVGSGAGADGVDAVAAAGLSSPWGGAPQALMSPLSPFR